jgi:hypothetical protein
MKRKIAIWVVLSLVAVGAIGGTMGSLFMAHAAEPKTGSFSGTITISSNVPGFTTKTKEIKIPLIHLEPTPNGNWNITIPSLSIQWNDSTTITLQDGKTGSGTLTSATNAVSLTLPLQGIPTIKTMTFHVSTEGPGGSPINQQGSLTLVGSESVGLMFDVHVTITGTQTPWPLQ